MPCPLPKTHFDKKIAPTFFSQNVNFFCLLSAVDESLECGDFFSLPPENNNNNRNHSFAATVGEKGGVCPARAARGRVGVRAGL
jgi:hypothetical protein